MIRHTPREDLAAAPPFGRALQPEAPDRTSPAEALGRLGQRLEDETGVTTTVVVTGERQPLAAPAEIALLRAQEGLAENKAIAPPSPSARRRSRPAWPGSSPSSASTTGRRR